MRLEKFSHGWFAFLAIFALFFGACGESSSEDSVNAPKTSENFSESPEGSNSSSGSTFGTLTDIRDGQTYKTVSIGTPCRPQGRRWEFRQGGRLCVLLEFYGGLRLR